MDTQKRIGIFQVKTGLACHTLNSAILLEKEGFIVDLFLYQTPIEASLENIENNPRINLYIFDNPYTYPLKTENRWITFFKKVVKKIGNRLSELHASLILFLFTSKVNKEQISFFIHRSAREQVDALIKNKNYQCFIGVEKLGIVWAGSVALKFNIPYAYHSLELYTKDHYLCRNSFRMKLIRRLEELYHAKSNFTIIQDSSRSEVLLQDHGLPSNRKLALLPVSLLGSTYRDKKSFLQKKYNLRDDQVIILQFGHLSRFGLDLTKHFQRLPEEYKLVLHYGLINDPKEKQSIITQYKKEDTRDQVYLSLEPLKNHEKFKELVSSAHIGLALYPNTCKNNLLTILSSEKIALYLQCGIPLIAFAHPGYELIEEQECGVLIRAFDELEYAIRKIMDNHQFYRANAFETFLKYYSFEKNFESVLEAINAMKIANIKS